MNPFVPLEFLAAGEVGRVSAIDGCREMVVRLAEMGFQQGVDIRMVQPGSPCIVALNNHRISFRGEEAAMVMVEILMNGRRRIDRHGPPRQIPHPP